MSDTPIFEQLNKSYSARIEAEKETETMSIEQMRKELSKLYGPSWVRQVEQMSDKQVAAVYMRHLNKGAFNKK